MFKALKTDMHDHSLAVVGSRAGIYIQLCLNELSIKWLPYQDHWCGWIKCLLLKEESFYGLKCNKASMITRLFIYLYFAILSPFNHGIL